MNFKYLLILRFALVNIIGIVFLFVAYTQGYIQRAMNADITNVILLIFILFFVGFLLATLRTFG